MVSKGNVDSILPDTGLSTLIELWMAVIDDNLPS
jgi:hypothetical protein